MFTSVPQALVNVSTTDEAIRVSCSATGSPLPEITWYKNNVTIPSPNNVTRDEVTSELVIDQFQTSIQTQYTCVARNEYNDEVKTSTKLGRAHVLLFLSSPRSQTTRTRLVSYREENLLK